MLLKKGSSRPKSKKKAVKKAEGISLKKADNSKYQKPAQKAEL